MYKIVKEIVEHPILGNIEKYFIYYFGGEYGGLKEFYAEDLSNPQGNIRQGYTKHPESL